MLEKEKMNTQKINSERHTVTKKKHGNVLMK